METEIKEVTNKKENINDELSKLTQINIALIGRRKEENELMKKIQQEKFNIIISS